MGDLYKIIGKMEKEIDTNDFIEVMDDCVQKMEEEIRNSARDFLS